MAGRRKKREAQDDPKLYNKRGELKSRVERRKNIKGPEWREVKKPWQKGGVTVDIDLTPPPILRADIRAASFGDGSRKTRPAPDGSPYTKSPRGKIRHGNRRHAKMAKASRMANR